MEEQELIEAKRARNFIWTAAEKYEFEPMFLAFSPDGTADMYLNLIIGLAYKWYDQEKIDAFFNQLGGKNQELYEGLLWIGLENTILQVQAEQEKGPIILNGDVPDVDFWYGTANNNKPCRIRNINMQMTQNVTDAKVQIQSSRQNDRNPFLPGSVFQRTD